VLPKVNDRYSRQAILPGIGKTGQEKLANSSIVIIGCGALGTVTATTLVRAGVGRVKIVDRDFIEYHNLQRQVIFDEDDIREQLPKAIAAERHLKKVNSTIDIKGVVADVNYTNIERLVSGVDLIVDGLDNLETRLLINDTTLKLKIPWIYGGAISSYGMMMSVIPGKTPCLRCIGHNSSSHSLALTCDTAGVIAPAPFVVGSLQAIEAIKILIDSPDVNPDLLYINVWLGEVTHLKVTRRPNCPSCAGKYEYLDARFGTRATSLCGQNAVQVISPESQGFSLPALANRLQSIGKVNYNDFMLTFFVDSNEMVVFPDGRAIIKNTTDESAARGLYAKYVGA
jgi:molybdopterin/thiamine biosynthesis adenylyltransferase